jgi:hypothetical protein
VSLLDRFRRIERSRQEPPAPAVDPETAERIESVERPGRTPGAPSSSGADLDRFAPPPPPPIELVETDADQRPFTRCMRCGMDHNVFATECAGCGASLDTQAQRDFNERLWRQRQGEREVEARMAAEREELRARAEAELAASRRAMGEALAREVGERERARLSRDGLGGREGAALGEVAGGIADAVGAAARWLRDRLFRAGPR